MEATHARCRNRKSQNIFQGNCTNNSPKESTTILLKVCGCAHVLCAFSMPVCLKKKSQEWGMRETKTFINLTHSSMNRCQFKARLYSGAYILSTSTRTAAKLVNTPCHTLAISVWSQLAIWIHHCWSKSWAFTPQHIIIYPPPVKKIVLFGSHTQNTARIIKKSQTKNIKRLQGVTVQNFISAMAKIQQFQKMNNKLLWTLEMNISAEILTFSCLQRAFWLHRLLFETT